MRGQPHFPNLHAIRAPKTRSGRSLGVGGLSPGVAGKGFCVAGYFAGVMFGVCAGQACLCLFSSLCLCVCVLVC
nr:MAG TPA: hypothetical protein [Caudoviricetes sp.]